ncbi:hypothetical protein C789_1588 [Microcystis aeruginosa FACHB-905 = DIANCHI905]|nr:hypothetical protein C789_1588 [Microcystis aeruginosa FACHB-905 = DIANCHI905]
MIQGVLERVIEKDESKLLGFRQVHRFLSGLVYWFILAQR